MSYSERRDHNNYKVYHSKRAKILLGKVFSRATTSLIKSLKDQIVKHIESWLLDSSDLQAHIQKYITIKKIDASDPREPLQGQDGAFATINIPKNTVLGIYTGEYITEN
jgi:hypothetical protein